MVDDDDDDDGDGDGDGDGHGGGCFFKHDGFLRMLRMLMGVNMMILWLKLGKMTVILGRSWQDWGTMPWSRVDGWFQLVPWSKPVM